MSKSKTEQTRINFVWENMMNSSQRFIAVSLLAFVISCFCIAPASNAQSLPTDCNGCDPEQLGILPCAVSQFSMEIQWVAKTDPTTGDPIYDEISMDTWNKPGGLWSPNADPELIEVLWEDLNPPPAQQPKSGIISVGDVPFGNWPNVSTNSSILLKDSNGNSANVLNTSGNIKFNLIWKGDVMLPNGQTVVDIVDCDCVVAPDGPLCWDYYLMPNAPQAPGPVLSPHDFPIETGAPGACTACATGGATCRSPVANHASGIAGYSTIGPQTPVQRLAPFMDWSPAYQGGAGCSSCGSSVSIPIEATMPALSIRRHLVPSNQVTIGSSSPGMFYDFDYRITFMVSDGRDVAVFFDPESHRSFYYKEDTADSGSFVLSDNNDNPILHSFFEDFQVEDIDGGSLNDPGVSLASMYPPQNAPPQIKKYVTMTRRNGWKYKLRLVYMGPDLLSMGRLVEMTSPEGYKISLTYPNLLEGDVEESPSRLLKIDEISDDYGNVATIQYNVAQQAGRWVIDNIQVRTADTAQLTELRVRYEYDLNGQLSAVFRTPFGSTVEEETGYYFYGTDSQWSAATLTYDMIGHSPRRETLFLSQDYLNWDGELVNQFAQISIGKADANGAKYLSISQEPNLVGPGAYRINERGKLREWLPGSYLKYAVSLTTNGSTEGGWHAYTNIIWEPTYAHYPSSTSAQAMTGIHPRVVDETGYGMNITYDAAGNPLTITYDGDPAIEEMRYDAGNRMTYYRDREGNVTTWEFDSGNGNRLIRKVRGLVDSGSGAEADPQTPAIHTLYEYHASGPETGLLKSMFTGAVANTGPVDTEKTQYGYDNQGFEPPLVLNQITSPEVVVGYDGSGAAETLAPVTTLDWQFGRLDDIIVKSVQLKLNAYSTSTLATVIIYDEFDRVVRTTFPDGSTEETAYDDDLAAVKVYRKSRTGVVSKTEYDLSLRVSNHFEAWAMANGGITGTILDANHEFDPSAVTINSINDYTQTTYTYYAIQTQPFQVMRDRALTMYNYDYRNRRIETKRYPFSTQPRIDSVTYVNNMVFSTTDEINGYSRTTYIGYSADRQEVRKIQCREPSITFADNAAVITAVREANTAVEPDYIVIDAIRDLAGNLLQTIDAYGTETLNEFDAMNRQISSTQDPAGFALQNQTVYDADGNVEKTIDPAGTETVMEYDLAGNVTRRRAAAGTTDEIEWRYGYDLGGRQRYSELVHDETGLGDVITRNLYSECCGRLLATENPDGSGTIFVVDDAGRTTHTAEVRSGLPPSNWQNPDDNRTSSESTTVYGPAGRIKYRTIWKSPRGSVTPNEPIEPEAGNIADAVTTQYVYIKRIINNTAATYQRSIARLDGTTATIDLDEAITRVSAPLTSGGANVNFTGARRGTATVVIAPDEKTMSVTIMDGMGRTVLSGTMGGPAADTGNGDEYAFNELIDAVCTQYDKTFTAPGYSVEGTASIFADGTWNRSFTNGFGWTVASRDRDGNISNRKHDSGGNVRESIDANLISVTYDYDILGRQTEMTTFAGTTKTTYEASTGRVDSREDANGNVTDYVYDFLGRVTTETDRLGQDTVRAYNDRGLLMSITDATGKATLYGYDVNGRRNSTTVQGDPQSTDVVHNVDEPGQGPGRQMEVILPSGIMRTSTYLMSGVLDKVEYFTDGRGTPTSTGTDDFSYDDYLRKEQSVSIDGVTHDYLYNQRGQLTSDAVSYNGNTHTVTYGHDDRGRLEIITYPSQRVVDYTYTDRDELDTVTWNGDLLEDRAYDLGGRLTNVDRNSVDEVRVYDDANRLSSIDNTGVGMLSYTWDANSNKLSETWTGNMAAWSFTTEKTGASFASGYDDEDRLRRFIRTGTQATDVYLDRGDHVNGTTIGNITDVVTNTISEPRSYSDSHELDSVDSVLQSFDNDGNMLQSQHGVDYSWNGAGRMTQCTVESGDTAGLEGTCDYGYDAEGKRIYKTFTPTGGSATTTMFVYAGPNCVAEYVGSAVSTAPDMEYVYGTTIDSLLLIDGSEKLTVTRNQQWSVTALSRRSDGTVLERYTYDVFGQRLILAPDGSTVRTSSNYNNPYGYTSRRHDDESGLMYFRARYYDTSTGEFTSRDPLEYVDGMSMYRRYMGLTGTDSYGLNLKQEPNAANVANLYWGQTVKPDFQLDGELGYDFVIEQQLNSRDAPKPDLAPGAQSWQLNDVVNTVLVWNPDENKCEWLVQRRNILDVNNIGESVLPRFFDDDIELIPLEANKVNGKPVIFLFQTVQKRLGLRPFTFVPTFKHLGDPLPEGIGYDATPEQWNLAQTIQPAPQLELTLVYMYLDTRFQKHPDGICLEACAAEWGGVEDLVDSQWPGMLERPLFTSVRDDSAPDRFEFLKYGDVFTKYYPN